MVKKLIIIVFISFVFVAEGVSQAKSKLECTTFTGTILQGSGDILSMSLGAQVVFRKWDHFMINSQFQVAQGSDEERNGYFYSIQAQNIEFGVRFIPILMPFDWFSMEANVSARRVQYITGDSHIKVIDSDNSGQHGSPFNLPSISREMTVGISTALNFRLFQKTYYTGGIKGILQGPYVNGDTNPGILIYFGLRI